jgi:CheY-like chemotaxis protein
MGTETRSVLLVEDDSAYRYALAKQLKSAGFAVFDAADYVDALNRLDTDTRVDLLIADIRLPKDTPHGFSIARMARVKRPALPVLFITAFDPPREEVDFPNCKILSKQMSLDMIVLEAQETLGVAH